MPASATCATHDDVPAAARCASCDRAVCADCWQSLLDGRPTCQPCVHLLTRPVPLAVPLIAVVLGWLVLARIAAVLPADLWFVWLGWAFAALITPIAAWRGTRKANQRRRTRVLAPRPTRAGATLAMAGHPYRGALRRSARQLAPPVSGAMAALVVGSALVVTAAALPALLRLPVWVELELVLAGWWLVWVVALTTLLYRGWRVADAPDPARGGGGSNGGGGSWDLGGFDVPGDGEAILVILGVILAFLLGWLVVDLLAPALMLLGYALLVGALRRVANDRHGCEDRLGASLAWGLFWATLYTAPLAAAALLVKMV